MSESIVQLRRIVCQLMKTQSTANLHHLPQGRAGASSQELTKTLGPPPLVVRRREGQAQWSCTTCPWEPSWCSASWVSRSSPVASSAPSSVVRLQVQVYREIAETLDCREDQPLSMIQLVRLPPQGEENIYCPAPHLGSPTPHIGSPPPNLGPPLPRGPRQASPMLEAPPPAYEEIFPPDYVPPDLQATDTAQPNPSD